MEREGEEIHKLQVCVLYINFFVWVSIDCTLFAEASTHIEHFNLNAPERFYFLYKEREEKKKDDEERST